MAERAAAPGPAAGSRWLPDCRADAAPSRRAMRASVIARCSSGFLMRRVLEWSRSGVAIAQECLHARPAAAGKRRSASTSPAVLVEPLRRSQSRPEPRKGVRVRLRLAHRCLRLRAVHANLNRRTAADSERADPDDGRMRTQGSGRFTGVSCRLAMNHLDFLDAAVIQHLGSRFLSAGVAVATTVTVSSGGLAWLCLIINEGRANFFEALSQYVDVGVAIGFALGIPAAVVAFATNLH